MVKQLQAGEVRGWLELGAFLLLQTAIVAAFIMGISTDVSYLKKLADENRSEHAAILADLRVLDTMQYKLEQSESQLSALRVELSKRLPGDQR